MRNGGAHDRSRRSRERRFSPGGGPLRSSGTQSPWAGPEPRPSARQRPRSGPDTNESDRRPGDHRRFRRARSRNQLDSCFHSGWGTGPLTCTDIREAPRTEPVRFNVERAGRWCRVPTRRKRFPKDPEPARQPERARFQGRGQAHPRRGSLARPLRQRNVVAERSNPAGTDFPDRSRPRPATLRRPADGLDDTGTAQREGTQNVVRFFFFSDRANLPDGVAVTREKRHAGLTGNKSGEHVGNGDQTLAGGNRAGRVNISVGRPQERALFAHAVLVEKPRRSTTGARRLPDGTDFRTRRSATSSRSSSQNRASGKTAGRPALRLPPDGPLRQRHVSSHRAAQHAPPADASSRKKRTTRGDQAHSRT